MIHSTDLHKPIENKLSSGQKKRLLLGRVLYRAYHRHSALLILDEPDKGLPNETTMTVIQSILQSHRPRDILFLTLHAELAHSLAFDPVAYPGIFERWVSY